MKKDKEHFIDRLRKAVATTTVVSITAATAITGCASNNKSDSLNQNGYLAKFEGRSDENGRIAIHKDHRNNVTTVSEKAMAYVNGNDNDNDNDSSNQIVIIDGPQIIVEEQSYLNTMNVKLVGLAYKYILKEKESLKLDNGETTGLDSGKNVYITDYYADVSKNEEISDRAYTKKDMDGDGKKERVDGYLKRSSKKTPAYGEKAIPEEVKGKLLIMFVKSGTDINGEIINGDQAFFATVKEKQSDDQYYLILQDNREIPVNKEDIIQYFSIEEAAKYATTYEDVRY